SHPVMLLPPLPRPPRSTLSPYTTLFRAQRDRAVSGEIYGGTRPVLDPVAERAASLVGDLARRDDESVDLAGALGDMSEGPLPVEVCRGDREVWRGHHVGEVVRRGTGLLGDVRSGESRVGN